MDLFVRTCDYARMNVSRLFARAVAVIWIIVGALTLIGVFRDVVYEPRGADVIVAAVALVIGLVILVVAFFYEVLAAVMSWVVAAALVVFGLISGWSPGSWLFMLIVVIGPMAVAGFLYFLASQTQKVCELEEGSSSTA